MSEGVGDTFLFRGSLEDSSLGSGLHGTPVSSRTNATPSLGPPLWAGWYVTPVAAVLSVESMSSRPSIAFGWPVRSVMRGFSKFRLFVLRVAGR